MSKIAERATVEGDRQRDLAKLEKVIDKVVGAMQVLSKDNERLRLALGTYGQHKKECGYWAWMEGRSAIMMCTCGLNEIKQNGK